MSIRLENLRFAYFEDGKNILDGVTWEFQNGKITLLTGDSGCGKSTLLYVMAGLYPHNAGFLMGGTVAADGRNPAELPPEIRCRKIGMMFQNPDLQFCMDTVRNEMIFCLENIREKPENFEEKMRKALDFCGISHLESRTLASLSGGEKQRVALACLLLEQPAWMLLDEPFANIDDDSAKEILRRLIRIRDEFGTGIIAVDHRMNNWAGIADDVLTMTSGKIEEGCFSADEPYPVQREPAKKGEAVLGLRDVSVTHWSRRELRVWKKNCRNAQGAADRQHADPAELRGADSSEPGRRSQEAPYTLEHVNVEFCRGMIYAIVGPSGSGKSTLFGALSGLYEYEGQISFHGRELRKVLKKEYGKIGFVTQNPQDQFIGGDVRHEIMSALKKLPDAEKKCEEILRGIKLWKYRDVSPYMLSQGQQRRLGVAALMAYPCEVLICDEPTYAQDRQNTITIMDTLTRQAREHQVALIFSTHDRQLAADYADEIWKIDGKTLVPADRPANRAQPSETEDAEK